MSSGVAGILPDTNDTGERCRAGRDGCGGYRGGRAGGRRGGRKAVETGTPRREAGWLVALTRDATVPSGEPATGREAFGGWGVVEDEKRVWRRSQRKTRATDGAGAESAAHRLMSARVPHKDKTSENPLLLLGLLPPPASPATHSATLLYPLILL